MEKQILDLFCLSSSIRIRKHLEDSKIGKNVEGKMFKDGQVKLLANLSYLVVCNALIEINPELVYLRELLSLAQEEFDLAMKKEIINNKNDFLRIIEGAEVEEYE